MVQKLSKNLLLNFRSTAYEKKKFFLGLILKLSHKKKLMNLAKN